MNLVPKQIIVELDKYIIGQTEAKKAVAIALRNRYRRSKLPPEIREEITPKNIIMKGPTGVGKTEIARRLAKLVRAPFIKVEATKYTEVGYVGRDVESMVRDLVEVAVRLVKDERLSEVYEKATKTAQAKVSKLIADAKKSEKGEKPDELFQKEITEKLIAGEYNGFVIELEVVDMPKSAELIPGSGTEINIGNIFGDFMPKRRKKRKITVQEALNIITAEEADKLIDNDTVNTEGLRRAEQEGIIFIDEIDKIASKGKSTSTVDVSREGVQRDILPIVEGCTVMSKYGPIKTDYILFIAAGAFHMSKLEDLIPELQGRFPIKVELLSLTKKDFVDILTQPQNAIVMQYKELLKVDNINLSFTDDAITQIAEISEEINMTTEDIGARRLHTVMELLLTDISFNAGGDYPMTDIVIDKKYVLENTAKTLKSQNLKKYIL